MDFEQVRRFKYHMTFVVPSDEDDNNGDDEDDNNGGNWSYKRRGGLPSTRNKVIVREDLNPNIIYST
jgi:hypothetical protein